MCCEHKRIRCTNNDFYCLDCGAQISKPESIKAEAEAKEPTKRKKKGA